MSFFVCLKNVTLIIGGMNLLGYFITAITKTHKITDLTGCSSFVVATILLSLQSSRIFKQFPKKDEFSIFENRLFFVNLAVILWGTRLGSFLFTRILSMKEDKRLSKFFPKENEGFFDRTKSNFPFYLGFFWTLQALWGIICLLPVSIINTIPLQWVMNRKFPTQTALNVSYSLFGLNLPTFVEYIPICGIFIGIFIETLADYQKSVYRSKPTNKHHWCDVGLWSLSRYPNYFGEILTWWSIYFTTFPGLVEAGIADGEGSEYLYPLLGLFSPVFITFLLLKVSGIPLLEKKHYKEFGNIPEYKDYVRRTSLLLPWPSSSSKKHSQKSK